MSESSVAGSYAPLVFQDVVSYDAYTSYKRKQFEKIYKDLVNSGLLFFCVTAIGIVLGATNSFFKDRWLTIGSLEVYNAFGFCCFLVAKYCTGYVFGQVCFTGGVCALFAFVSTIVAHRLHNTELVAGAVSIMGFGTLCGILFVHQHNVLHDRIANRPPGPEPDYANETLAILKRHDNLYKDMCDAVLTFFLVTALGIVIGTVKSVVVISDTKLIFLESYTGVGFLAMLIAKLLSGRLEGYLACIVGECAYAAFVMTAITHRYEDNEVMILCVSIAGVTSVLGMVFVRQRFEIIARNANPVPHAHDA